MFFENSFTEIPFSERARLPISSNIFAARVCIDTKYKNRSIFKENGICSGIVFFIYVNRSYC